MNKKDYQKPAMNIVKLQHTQMLMASGVKATRNGYGAANQGFKEGDDTWE